MSNEDTRSIAPCVPAPVAAEWMPLDALIGQWADFAREPQAVSALVLELISDALLACSYEMSAHKEYATFASHGSARDQRPYALTHGLDECIRQLSDACSRWSSVMYWLAQLDDEAQQGLDLVRQLSEASSLHQRRVERLLLRVQEEQVHHRYQRQEVRP
jgi:hypothetical protein